MPFARWIYVLAASCCGLSAQAVTAQSTVPIQSVGIFVAWDELPRDDVIEAMKGEVSDIFAAMGVHIAWRLQSENKGIEWFEHLAMIRLTGKCASDSRDYLPPSDGVITLGLTAAHNGVVQSFGEVRCDAVLRVLYRAQLIGQRRLSSQEFGRALGLVAAHEAYHILSGRRDHETTGVAKSCLTSQDLLLSDGRLGFDGGVWKMK